ncbi:MAG: hypothetical protein IKF07_07340 [Eubacterium sp.]|nr:hypothetical protein [Eubacterium sp.]
MKMKSINMPAVLLAVIAAMVLMMAAGATTAYADDTGYDVEIKPVFKEGFSYIALPGGSIPLTADVYYDFEGESYRDDGDLEFKWELGDDDSQFAKLKVHKYTNSLATVEFRNLPAGETEIDAIISVKVTAYSDDVEVGTDTIFLLESDDYYQMYPTYLDSYLGVGESREVEVEVRHYSLSTPKSGEIVKNVEFDWEVDGGAFEGLDKPVSRTDEKAVYNIKRMSAEESLLVLHGKWGEGEDTHEEWSVLWTENIPTDLNEYKVKLPSDINSWEDFVDEGEVIDRQYLEDNTSVYYERKDETLYLKNGIDYELKVQKYLGYNEETGIPVWKDWEGDLKTDPKGSEPDLNGEPTEGTGIFRVIAVAKGDTLTGMTEDYAEWVYMYSKKSISGYAPFFEFDYTYGSYLDDEPWFRYDVKPGVILDPTVKLNDEELEEGKDYTVNYYGINVDYAGTEFPEDPGEYYAFAEGIGEYYGTTYIRYIKVGKTNLDFIASGKTIKAKASKKMTFAKAKAFKVSGNKGTVSFEKISGDKKITVSSAGKVTVKKGLKKGKTYKVKVKVIDSDSDLYFTSSKTVTLKVKVAK